MSNPYSQSRRAVYRVVYPPTERPRFVVDDQEFEVLDCSELGLRYTATGAHHPELGGTVDGRVVFKRRLEVPVAGEVVRVDHATIALWFRTLSLSYTVIVAEQEYLRAKGYPVSDTP